MAGEPFNFWNGKTASDLDSLVNVLSEISDEEFSLYVNGSKNDFANWIEYSLENKEVADKVRPLLQKDTIKEAINSVLENKTNTLIIGTTKALQEDSLVKEILQKNEEFFNEISQNKSGAEKTEPEKVNKSFLDRMRAEKSHTEETASKKEDTVKEKGSTLSFADVPKLKNGLNKELYIGLMFGFIMGVLVTLIALQLIMA